MMFRLTLLALSLLVMSYCSSSPIRDDSARKLDRETETETLSVEESRRRAEEAYREMERRSEAQRKAEQSAAEASRKEEAEKKARAEEKAEAERRAEAEKKAKQLEADRAAEEQDLLQKWREEAMHLRLEDLTEERSALEALRNYRKNRPQLQAEAKSLSLNDAKEQMDFNTAKQTFLVNQQREQEYREGRMDRADPTRLHFFRKDSQAAFPGRIEIDEVVGRRVALFRNRKAHQFMGYTKTQKFVPAVQSVPLFGGPARRLHLYEFLKGRPGNYVLLDASGMPVQFRWKNQEYRIINIRSDGDVLILLDLERDDLGEYHRISVDDITLIME